MKDKLNSLEIICGLILIFNRHLPKVICYVALLAIVIIAIMKKGVKE